MLDQSFLPLAQNLIQLGVGCSFGWLLDFSVRFFFFFLVYELWVGFRMAVPLMALLPMRALAQLCETRKEEDNKAIPLMLLSASQWHGHIFL